MHFAILGPVEVTTGDGKPVRVPEARIRALLADLLAHHGQVVSADRLMEHLWGDNPPARGKAVLRSKVSQLRRVLADDDGGARITWQAPGYRIDLGTGQLDLARFEELVGRAAQSPPPRRAALLSEALRLWRGEPLPEIADQGFAAAILTRLTEQRLGAIEARLAALLEVGDDRDLIGELSQQVQDHPLRERLRMTHMRALYRAGRQADALESFQEYRRLLADELGLTPGHELSALHQAILRQEPGLSPAPAVTTGNLPHPATPLIGRDRMVEEVGDRLTTDTVVTLTGPGGVGKTRLAVEVAGSLRSQYPDGVWFIDLTALAGEQSTVDELNELIATTVEATGDCPAVPAHSSIGHRLESFLRHKRALLILDNGEHVVDAAAAVATRLARLDSDVRILTTSREPLGVPGERLVAVEPLTDADGVRLFTAHAERAGFSPGTADADALTEICRHLDGIPLALELAATRVGALGPSELARRLRERSEPPTAPRRGVPDRQRTVWNTIDWSWRLLTGPERTVLARLSPHRQPFTLAAATAIAGFADVTAGEVPELVARLTDRSLLTFDGDRYRMLNSVGQYGRDRLAESTDHATSHQRFLGHYLDLANRANLLGSGQVGWLARLDAEAGNLREAVRLAAEIGESADGMRLVNSLAWYWLLRGRLTEASAAFDRFAAEDSDAGDAAIAAAWRAGIANRRGEPGADGRAIRFDDIADPGARARARWFLAHSRLGRTDGSESRLIALTIDEGGDWERAAGHATSGYLLIDAGDLDAAHTEASKAWKAFSDLGDEWGVLYAGGCLAELAELDDDPATARRLHEEGLAIAERLNLRTELTRVHSRLGRIALLGDRLSEAEEHYRTAARLADEQCDALVAHVAEVGVELVAATRDHIDGGDAGPRSEATVVTALTELLTQSGRRFPGQAAQLLGTLAVLRERDRLTLTDGGWLRVADGLRTRLGAADFDEGLSRGRRMAVHEHLDWLTRRPALHRVDDGT
ncbi:putative ATPase [Stackebrandtia endophytica]|uniref:Putative ATPase n=1 Tax=Stackebrandtia endophytica TaxID=1496996 RepID=A0A543ATZ0_9ACTN|nr:BTAD domain-containing putative transcriptional regulator [Stackebrandtia endophytica]TQL76047.1 putative ATPase [Stackebrandtia endophytica]